MKNRKKDDLPLKLCFTISSRIFLITKLFRFFIFKAVMKAIYFCTLSILISIQLNAQSVQFDETWANQGFVALELPDENLILNDYFLAEDDQIFAVGYTQTPESTFKKSILIKINSDGSIDNDFGENGMVRPELYYDEDHEFTDVLKRNDGTLLAVGNMESGQGPAISAFFMSFNPDGSTDTSYGDEGFSEEYGGQGSGTGYPDIYKGNSGDQFYIRTYFHQSNNFPELSVSRSGENSWYQYLGDGFDAWYQANKAYISPQDEFYLGMSYNGSSSYQGTAAVIKFNDQGMDASFGTDGVYEYAESVPGDGYSDVEGLEDGNILTIGTTEVNDLKKLIITKLDASGQLVEDFDLDGHLIYGDDSYDYYARSVHYMESEGKILIRFARNVDGVYHTGFLALDTDGNVETDFGQEGIFWADDLDLPGAIQNTELLDNENLLFSGSYTNADGNTTSYFGKLLIDFEYEGFQNNLMALNSSQTSYFREADSNRIYAVEVEAESFDGDSIFHPYANWYKSGFSCYLPDYCSILGKEVRVSQNGTHRFITGLNDTITLLFQGNINDQWIAYTSADGSDIIEATISSVEPEEYFDEEILVKTIGLQMMNSDMEPVSDPVNDWYFKFSEDRGLLAFPSLAKFPQFEQLEFEQSSMKDLVGIEGQVGVQDLDYFDVFDFEIGDEIHYEEGHSSSFTPATINIIQIALSIIDKTVYTDSLVYVVEKKLWEYSGLQSEINIQPTDTIVESMLILPDSLFDLPPARSLINQNSDLGYFGWISEGEFGTEKNFYFNDPVYMTSADSCFETAIDWGCSGGESIEHYYNGLGGPYYICESSDFSTWWRQLIYFRKGDVEWGSALSTVELANTDLPIRVYPNPSQDRIQIDFEYTSQNLEIRVLNPTGKLVDQKPFHTGFLDVSRYPAGIYFLQILEDNRILSRTKFVVQK